MRLLLKRRYLGPEYTIGTLYINGMRFCDTIEDKVRDLNKDGDLLDEGEEKVFGETAIPGRKYKMELSMSPKFKRVLPMILDVPGFTGIRIHRGNTAKDSHGCILPGENKVKGQVINSTQYELALVERMKLAIANEEELTIIIR